MTPADSNSFEHLGKFCEDGFEDEWERNEAKAELISGRYSEKIFLADGALKNVYKVFDSKMKRHIALAELKEEIPEEDYDAFFDEASLTSSLRHPNIITVYDFGFNEAHVPYFTMELKVGDTLGQILRSQQKDLDTLLEIFIKVCDAISYSHSLRIIHLDLKPDNIQVGEFGEVQVCDWGLSCKEDNLKTGKIIKGTPGFMAPEQILPGETLDHQADIFALGGILYSILTKVHPIEGGCDTVISSTVSEEIVAPVERCPEKSIPTSLNAVVCKAMANDREERYQNVEELKSEVTKYLMGKSTEAENAGFLKELSLFIKRNKQVCALAFFSAAAFIVGTLIFLVEIQKSKSETERAFSKLEIAYEERQKLNNELLARELAYANELMVAPLYFSSPKKSLEKSLIIYKSQYETTGSESGISDQIVLNLFISQKYQELQEYRSERYRSLQEIAMRFKDLERTNKGVFTSFSFNKILQAVNFLPVEQQSLKQEVFERSICFMVDINGREVVPSGFVQELIKCWNPQWDSNQFSYSKSTNTLKVNGEHLVHLISDDLNSSGECFLRFLRFEILDIRDSNIESLSQIRDLPIKKIDIRGTNIENLHPHNATKDIHEVYLDKGQFSPENEKRIPKHVRLVYSD